MANDNEIVNISDNDDDCVLEAVVCNKIYKQTITYNHIYNECPYLAKIIEKCFTLENSDGMLRVINKSLLGMYKEADAEYKMSSEFKKVLHKTLVCLDKDPYHRFSHIKVLCDTLKKNKYKKRVQLTTLKNNSDLKMSSPFLKRNSSLEKYPKKFKSDVIDLNNVEIPVIMDCDPENAASHHNDTVMMDNSPIIIEDEKENCADKLLVPHNSSQIDEDENIIDIEKVKKLEQEIATYKEMIAKLDEEEVTDDDSNSPYLKSEKLKAKIVSLYEELCKCKGTKSVKKRKIRLQVIEGHPVGPVQRLESFLNKNIGSSGDPPFPDFFDVVKCVLKANIKDKLGWNKHQVLQEASALFTHCGRALQKRRKERELGDLLSRVKTEKWDDDPADDDPELLARLEANKKEAMKKEDEILERFSMMQRSVHNNNIKKRHAEQFSNTKSVTENAISSNEDGRPLESLTNNIKHKEITPKWPAINRILDTGICAQDAEDSSSYKSDSEEDSSSDESQIDEEIGPTSADISDGTGSFELPDMNVDRCMNDAEDKRSVESNAKIEFDEVKIKKEPTEDIIKLLNELGDNYSVSIVDIEDPFLVIEISDSSDED